MATNQTLSIPPVPITTTCSNKQYTVYLHIPYGFLTEFFFLYKIRFFFWYPTPCVFTARLYDLLIKFLLKRLQLKLTKPDRACVPCLALSHNCEK